MPNLEIRKAGVLKVFLLGEPGSTAEAHIRNGYPALTTDFEAGLLTVREIEGSPIETPEDVAERAATTARADEERLQNAMLRGIARVLLNHENRLRTLEGKPAVTIEQFKAAVKAILDI